MPKTSGSLATPLPPTAPNLSRLILDRVAASPDRPAFGSPKDGSWTTITWREAGDEMIKLAAGLLALGLQLEDRVAIASGTRTEWILADGAVMLAGGANTTIYPSTSEDDFAYIVNDSGARFLIAEDTKQAEKALSQRDQLPELTTVILIDGEGDGETVLSWAQLRDMGVARLKDAWSATIRPHRSALSGTSSLTKHMSSASPCSGPGQSAHTNPPCHASWRGSSPAHISECPDRDRHPGGACQMRASAAFVAACPAISSTSQPDWPARSRSRADISASCRLPLAV